MPPEPTSTESLLRRLIDTPDDSLEEGVEKTEGVNGSTVEPVYSTRKMKCYSVTESELMQINLANIGITAFTSLGSAMFAFWLDIFKDTLLAAEIPPQAVVVIGYIQPVLLLLGVLFWVFAAIALLWRRSMITLIKKESVEP